MRPFSRGKMPAACAAICATTLLFLMPSEGRGAEPDWWLDPIYAKDDTGGTGYQYIYQLIDLRSLKRQGDKGTVWTQSVELAFSCMPEMPPPGKLGQPFCSATRVKWEFSCADRWMKPLQYNRHTSRDGTQVQTSTPEDPQPMHMSPGSRGDAKLDFLCSSQREGYMQWGDAGGFESLIAKLETLMIVQVVTEPVEFD